MSENVLRRIKRAVLEGRFAFSDKADLEMLADNITDLDVAEAILSANAIYKTLRSRSARRLFRSEKLYVIVGTNLDGLPIYTKGKFVLRGDIETYYFLISSKRAD